MSVRTALDAGGCTAAVAAAQAPYAAAAMLDGKITTKRRAAFFLAQVLHESGGLYYREEVWGPSAAQRGYEGRRDLGNTHAGDGYRFRGRGWIQLTGRANYRAAGRALGLPLEAKPGLAATPLVAWRIAVWYWGTRGLNEYADRNDFLGVTKRINGGTNGLDDRRRRLRAIGDIDARPTADPYADLEADERKAAKTYDGWKRRGVNLAGRKRLRAEMRVMRRRIWRLADPASKHHDGKGWTKNRLARYRALKARSD